jgi:hypothetical protein
MQKRRARGGAAGDEKGLYLMGQGSPEGFQSVHCFFSWCVATLGKNLGLCYAALQAPVIRVGGNANTLANVQEIAAAVISKTVKSAFAARRHVELRLGTLNVGIKPPFLLISFKL